MISSYREQFERLLPQVERPVRYTDSELFSVKTREVKTRIALLFPDTYEIGMSNYGLKVLYHIINGTKTASAERAFIPWVDMVPMMKKQGIPLHTLETSTPLSEFDMVGISLQSELGYTNALAALELSGIPLRYIDRSEKHPLIVAGGPCTANPLPLESFFDAFLMGDGEDAVREMADVLASTKSKSERLSGFAEIEGVWVPPIHGRSKTIRKRTVSELRFSDAPAKQILPIGEIEHDRLVVEIGRGCLRGCRFCQAGFANRPQRYRPFEDISALAEDGISATGWDEVSLLSFAVSDYPRLDELLSGLNSKLGSRRVSLSLPSFRGETFNERIGKRLLEIKKTGLTFAPETASVRLKKVINKNVANEEIINTALTAARLGWRHVKLYFMVGLPTETEEDIDMNIDFIRELAREAKGLAVNIHVASFVPKPHTPFQWCPFTDVGILEERISRMKEEAGAKRVRTKWARPDASFVEAVLARGDEKLAKVLEGVLQRGGYFQEWSENFKLERWLETFEETGVDPAAYTRERKPDERLPWEFLNLGISPEFLRAEYSKAMHEETRSDCMNGDCYDCGVGCSATDRTPGKIQGKPIPEDSTGSVIPRACSETANGPFRIRMKFEVGEAFRYASHLDFVRAVYRLLRRSGLSLCYTEGFSPHPRVSFGFPKPVGVTSRGEYVDAFLSRMPQKSVALVLERCTPPGLKITESRTLSLQSEAITKAASVLQYRVWPSPEEPFQQLVHRIAHEDSAVQVSVCDGKLTVFLANAARAKLWNSLSLIYKIPTSEARLLRVERVDAYAAAGDRLIPLLEETS